MKKILLLLLLAPVFGLAQNTTCGDGIVYANKKQTQYDDRFDSYTKISGAPKMKGGDEQLKEVVLANLKLADEAKNMVFRLNYQFTVTCDGKIRDVIQIGDPRMSDWTNIETVIQSTEADWTPAKNKGKPVDCVYFHKVTIVGSKF